MSCPNPAPAACCRVFVLERAYPLIENTSRKRAATDFRCGPQNLRDAPVARGSNRPPAPLGSIAGLLRAGGCTPRSWPAPKGKMKVAISARVWGWNVTLASGPAREVAINLFPLRRMYSPVAVTSLSMRSAVWRNRSSVDLGRPLGPNGPPASRAAVTAWPVRRGSNARISRVGRKGSISAGIAGQ
jgi:hypothetical protein